MNEKQSSRRTTMTSARRGTIALEGNVVTRVRNALPRSLQTVLSLLRNVGLGVLWTALGAFCGVTGNFFTGKRVAEQSEAEFLSMTMLWNQLMFCAFSLAAQSAILLRQRFVDRPNQPAGYHLCLKRVFHGTYHANILSILFPVVVVFTLNAVSSNSSCVLRFSFYVNCCAALVFMTSTTITVRRIFHETTVAGIRRQHRKMHESGSAISANNPLWKRHCLHFFRVMFQMSPGTISNIFSGIYVQVTTANMPTTQRDLAIFAGSSIALKLVIQELVKFAVVKRGVEDIRTMVLVVAVPTVLIDTQVRVMLQLANSVSTTIGGSIAMAFVEIAMRAGKMLFLRAQIRRRARRTYAPASPRRVASNIAVHPIGGGDSIQQREDQLASVQNFEVWKMQLLRFHAAEAYADMAAEYMALSASAIFVALYDDHPKYQFAHWAAGSNTSHFDESSQYYILLAFQLVLEFLVDSISCVVEIAHGVSYEELKVYESFVIALFIAIGIMNVQITAIMYLRCE